MSAMKKENKSGCILGGRENQISVAAKKKGRGVVATGLESF
jgi:hypothetical protein